MATSRAKHAQVADRRAKLVKLRLAGVKFDDPRILTLGYASRQAASKDMIRALEEHREEEAAAVSAYRQQENERLDTLLEAVWDKATKPSPVFNKEREIVAEEIDVRAVETVLRLMDRRAKLNGLDMPVKAEVTGADGGPLQLGPATTAELETLIGLGSTAPATLSPDAEDTEDDARDG